MCVATDGDLDLEEREGHVSQLMRNLVADFSVPNTSKSDNEDYKK